MAKIAISFQPDADGVARLSLPSSDRLRSSGCEIDQVELRDLLSSAVEQAFDDPGLHRLEIRVLQTDPILRWATTHAGFRLEGRRREAVRDDQHQPVDELIFSRLRTDRIGGADGFSAIANTITPRKRLIAHALMRDEAGRILLCRTTFKTDWELPGGIVEPDEAPRLGAIREIKEELGIDREIGPLLAVDWMPPYLGWEDAVELIFDGGLVTEDQVAAYRLDAREIAAAHLIDLADAEEHLTPLSFRRLSAITAANPTPGTAPGPTLILERGRPV